jgi:hypothetical protein
MADLAEPGKRRGLIGEARIVISSLGFESPRMYSSSGTVSHQLSGSMMAPIWPQANCS